MCKTRPQSNQLILGDSLEVMREWCKGTTDLYLFSPPYADQRKATYGGIHPDKYVEWFLPFSAEMLRTCKESGGLILNIKEKAIKGERHPYVMELVLAMRKQGWKLIDQYIWHKKNCFPGKWPNRLRDAWEHLFHFAPTVRPYMDQDAVRVPMGNWADTRLKNLSETDKTRDNSSVGSGFGKNVSNWVGRDTVLPTNVLHMATECGNKNHSAAYPEALVEFFIKLLCPENGLVVDPFLGSGTTAVIAKRLGRRYIGIEQMEEYYKVACKRLEESE